MPRVNINLDEVPEIVEPGWYPVKVVGGEIRDARDGESQYVHWILEITEDETFQGWQLRLNTSLKPQALPMLKRFLKAAGFEWDPEGFATEDIIGSELEVRVEHQEYRGEPRANVQGYRPL